MLFDVEDKLPATKEDQDIGHKQESQLLEHTDNISERGLRKYKRKQHQAVSFRSNASVAYLCDASWIETLQEIISELS